MSCTPPSLLKFYTNKLNIYDNANFIPLPNWKTCPAPPMEIIAPAMLVQPPCGPAIPSFLPQPSNPVGSYYIYQNPTVSYSQPSYPSCQSCQ
jgi:hypothetical protein